MAGIADPDRAWKALADPNRRAILSVVQSGPAPVGRIAEQVELSQQTTSHHLRVLRDAGLTHSAQQGTRHLYAVNTDGLAAIQSYLDGFWPERLSALKAAVESQGRVSDG
ncbi:ArsR/SmtB family transcription factor [Arthrobacter castelli]|uniref:ArsR/SmtB family transcription factor n=1 Tax=Arthrobacter castelli TaxID=271431 RepID=UPI0004167C7D|nr:metalloregulator ArsR/SmtB family transcription factor [Arthrobacter castelli]